MNPLTILLISAALHALAFACLIRHGRASRRRSHLPVIGSSPMLTETLHQRILHRQPQTDWLNPHVIRAKINTWRNRNTDIAP